MIETDTKTSLTQAESSPELRWRDSWHWLAVLAAPLAAFPAETAGPVSGAGGRLPFGGGRAGAQERLVPPLAPSAWEGWCRP